MADSVQEQPDKGRWSDDDLAKTANAALTSLPDKLDSESDIDRASRALARILKRRAKSPASGGDPTAPIVLLVCANWRDIGRDRQWSYEPAFDDGSSRLAGRLLVCPPSLSAAFAVDLPGNELGNIFTWIEGTLRLGQLSALLINPSASLPEIRIYPSGVAAADQMLRCPLYVGDLDLSSLDSALNRFYDDIVCAPGGGRKCEKLWDDPDNFTPTEYPEKKIQKELFRFLRTIFAELHIAEEEDVPLGRLDIRLSGHAGLDDFAIVHHAVVELKVLHGGGKKPPYSDTKDTCDRITKGTQQAAAYVKPPVPARMAMLGCYDMRPGAGNRGDTCFDHVRSVAKKENVELRRWPLFPTVDALRQHKVPVSQGTA